MARDVVSEMPSKATAGSSVMASLFRPKISVEALEEAPCVPQPAPESARTIPAAISSTARGDIASYLHRRPTHCLDGLTTAKGRLTQGYFKHRLAVLIAQLAR